MFFKQTTVGEMFWIWDLFFLAYFHLSISGSVSHKRLFIYLRHVSAVLDTYLTLQEAMRDTITLIKHLPTNSRA